MKTKPTTTTKAAEMARYCLDPRLVRRVRIEAAERGVTRSQVVAERLERSYRENPTVRSAN